MTSALALQFRQLPGLNRMASASSFGAFVVAWTQGAETIIAKGLGAGERVVIDGQPRLVSSARLEVRDASRR